jgi:hypothetical protein
MDRNGRARIDFLDPTKSETDRVQPILISIIIIIFYPHVYFSLVRDNHKKKITKLSYIYIYIYIHFKNFKQNTFEFSY